MSNHMKGRLVIEHLGGVIDLNVSWPDVYPTEQTTGAQEMAAVLVRMLGAYLAENEMVP